LNIKLKEHLNAKRLEKSENNLQWRHYANMVWKLGLEDLSKVETYRAERQDTKQVKEQRKTQSK